MIGYNNTKNIQEKKAGIRALSAIAMGISKNVIKLTY